LGGDNADEPTPEQQKGDASGPSLVNWLVQLSRRGLPTVFEA
jgi:hypothetical protein